MPDDDSFDESGESGGDSDGDDGGDDDRFSTFADDELRPSLDDDAGAGASHNDSVFEVDDELHGRESWLIETSAALEEAEARMTFADDISADPGVAAALSVDGEAVVEQAIDADPAALDAAAGLAAALDVPAGPPGEDVSRRHLRGLLEALLFVSDKPLKTADLADVARAEPKECRAILEELAGDYRNQARGFQLDELAGGWQLRTAAAFAPFVREMTALKPVKLTRAQVETLAIIAYRQPVTRPEIEDVRGVDAGPVVKLLLDRNLVRVLGKKDEPGRPLIYGTTTHFLEFFGLKSLRDLPTLREFTELTEESRETVERELGDVLPEGPREQTTVGSADVAAVDVDPLETTAEGSPAGAPIEAAEELAREAPVTEPEPPHGSDEAPTPATAPQDDPHADEADEAQRPGGAKYDPSDEELYPDDEDDDFDEDDEDEEDDDEDDDEAEEDDE